MIKGINYQELNYDQKFKQQRIINTNQLYFGNFLFQNSDSTQSNINQFTVSGWFFIRAISFDYFNIFSVILKGQQIFSVSFNLGNFNVRQMLLSSSQDQIVNTITNNSWFLIKSQISVQNSQIIAQTSVHSYGNLFLANIAASPQNFNQILSKTDIILEIGNSSQQPGIYESQAYSKNIYVYWDENIDDNKTQNYVDDFTALQTQLVWNFDFFYTKANPKSYVNTSKSSKIYLSNFDLGDSQILLVKSTTIFKTDYVNPLDFGGLVVTFHFKISSLQFTNLKLFQILNQQLVQISISVDSSSNIYLNTQQIQGVPLNQWNQITLVIKTLIINEAYLIVNTFDNLVQKITLNQQFLLGQLQFGDASNTLDIQFSHIRYYKGAFLTSNKGNCLLQDSRNTVSCIICQSGFFINYQGSLACSAQTLPSINVNKDNIIDWNENFQSCPQGMVYDPITYQCSCLNQFYMKSDNTCAKCPSYCNGCINQTTCIQQDEQRLGNGACQQGYFDDGYSCINQKLTIFSQTNIVKIFSIPNLNPICSQSINPTDYTLTESLLNLSQQNTYSFLFSFSYFFSQFKDNYSFAVFQDGMNEIFTFSVSQTTSYQFINFEIQGQIVYQATIKVGQVFWFVFWTNLKSITLLIQSNSQFFHTTINANLNIKLINPQFCVGPCKSAYHPAGYLCGDLEHRPLMFIRNITNPIYDLITLQMFLSNPTVNVALFKVSLFSDLTQIFKNQLAQNPSLILDFQNTPVQIHKLKGFGFTKQVKAVIQNINISGYYWISFYCSILPVTINSQTSLLSYPLNGGFVEYFLVPHGQKILIRICYITQCIDSKYSMLNLNESNHLFILMRHQSPFSGGIHFIEFDVICNYLREQIQFLSVSFSQSMPTISLNIGLQTLDTEDFLFYLNLINIDKGDGLYYFDYNPSQNCFIFQLIDKMNCIYYKNNLISYQNSMITAQECQSYNNNQPTFFIPNLQTRECINSLQTFPDCLTVDLVNNNLQCTQCIKSNADPLNNCSCIEGYYLDNSTNLCLKCNPICQACQNSKSNCTKCKYSNQITPTCDCLFPNYFLDQNLSCQKCSQQCETCTITKDSCLTCSQNRIDPPLCQCDNLNYIEINGICTKIICDNKCDKCQFDISSNSIICLKCKSGRQNLPECTCMKNYAENTDGTCSPCPNSQYVDPLTKECQVCQFPCLGCINTNSQCTFCYQGLQLINNTCSCGFNQEIKQLSEGQTSQFVCIEAMQTKLAVVLQITNYELTFTFDQSLKQIDFSKNPIQSLIKIQLSNVPQSYYSFENPQINENKLTLQLNVITSFYVSIGTALFLKTNIFESDDNRFILSSYYLTNPIQFKIGPFIFTEQQTQTKMTAVINNLKNSQYQNILTIIQQTQILFYLLNTAQPTLLFLLLKATFPPNLYIFYQIFGTFVFSDVVNYESTDYKQDFSIFGLKFDQKYVFLTDNQIFKRIGFSNTFLANTSLVILKYFVIFIVYTVLHLVGLFIQYFSQRSIVNILNAKSKILQRLNAENETNLLIVFVSILHQFTTFQQDLWSVSPYAVCVILGLLFLFSSILTLYYRPYQNLINSIIKIVGELILSAVWFLHIYILIIEDQLNREQQFEQNVIGINYQQLNYDQRFRQQRIIHSNQLYFGNILFQNSDSTLSSINQFTVSGWFFIRCSSNDYYNFFSFILKGQQIFSTSFSLGLQKVRQMLLSSNQEQTVNTIAFNSWFLIKSQISVQNSQIIAQTSVHSYGNLFLANIATSPQNFNQILSKIDITLEIGNSSQQPGIYESCAYSKNMYVYWDENIDDSKTQNYVDDFTAQQTQLVWNFDFFYTKANPKSYVNTSKSSKIYLSNFDLGDSQILLVKSSTIFKTDYVNPLDFGGLVITFHFKIPSLSFTNLKLFQILNQQVQISISVDSSSNINLNTQQIQGVSLNQWNQITLIIKTLIINEAYLIVNTFDNLVQKITLNQQFLLGQLQFGDSSNTLDIQFSHIRYYKGAFLTSNKGNCLLQDSRNTVSCIICQSGYFINYQGSLTCSAQTLPSINVNKDNIIDWNENFQSCPQGMVYDPITYKCSCLNQFYMKSDNTCAKCPSYCNGCINQTTCIQQDEQRLGNGVCQQGYFDDGYSCINQKLTIFSQTNIVKIFSIPNLNPICSQSINPTDYTLTESLLNLSQQNSYSFLFSFSYFFSEFKDNYSFAVFQDGMNEIFTFSVSQTSSYQFINFEIQGQIVYKAAVLTGQVVWIAFWTNLKSITLLIQSYSQFFHTTINANLNINLINPQFCVGPCKSAYHPAGYLCGDLEHRPLMFIRNITNPIYDLITLQMFLSNPTVNVALFKVSLFSDLTQIFKNQLAQNPSLILDFQNTPVKIHKLKGFGFTKQVKAVIQNINISGYYWISFYCSILPVTINSQISLLSYPLHGGFVEYFLVPHGQKILIRICYITQCIDSKYSMLNLNESNHLFILMRHQSPFSGGIHFIEFDVICNYLREQIQFLNVSFSQSMPTISLNIGLQTLDTEDFLFYLNLINIDKGDGLYYFDYNPSQNCFIFQLINKMNCIYYKNNLISYQNSMITAQECQSYNNNQPTFFIPNLQTRECINSLQTFPDCLTVDLVNNNLQCTQCIKSNADPLNNCFCIEGYYLDNSTNLCLKCNPICQACQNSKSNCTKCKYSNQITPTCDCLFPNYFLDQNFSCQKCSSQCETCTMTKDSCLTCSENRINPPVCLCDNANYIEINGICTKIICDNKCDKCQFDISSNSIICLKCKSGRQNLPECTCMKNYAENADGTCSPCPNSQYVDPLTKECQVCQFPCLECINTNSQCTFCYQGLQLINNTCSCGFNQEVKQLSEGQTSQFICIQAMQTKLAVVLQITNYELTFTFDQSLKQIDFSKNPIQNLLKIQLSNVPQSYYSFENPQINENNLTLQMNVNTSFQVSTGTALFLKTNIFESDDNRFILSSYYLTNPIQFKIGPFIFTDQQAQKNMAAVMNNLKSSQYQNMLSVIQQTQILFYLLNTAQPTLLFLLLKATFPPNLYIFYQIFGTFVFPGVVNYQSTDYKQSYSLFGLKFDQKQVFLTDNQIFKRIGFSNTFLVNASLVLLKYFVLLMIYGILHLIGQFIFYFSQRSIANILKAKSKILQRLNAENEANLLIVFVSILHQFTTFQQDLWSVRYGYYLAITFLIPLCCMCYPWLIISIFIYVDPILQTILESNEFSYKNKDQLNREQQFEQSTIETYLNIGNIAIVLLFIFNLIFLIDIFIFLFTAAKNVCNKKQNQKSEEIQRQNDEDQQIELQKILKESILVKQKNNNNYQRLSIKNVKSIDAYQNQHQYSYLKTINNKNLMDSI
ncbi:hypothetical protein ABPG74_018421 [Tetrahymena malaccensis]